MAQSNGTDVTVILVGFNSRENLGPCLDSVFRTRWGTHQWSVVFVDNASQDGSVEFVKAYDASINVISNTENLGFSRACNQAAELIDSRYYFLLNNDAILDENAIPLLIEFLDQHPQAGAAGSRLLEPDGSDQWSARRFPTGIHSVLGRRSALTKLFPECKTVRHYLYKDELQRGEPFLVDWVPGSCTLVSREAYAEVRGLPEDMHYWSDAVFCDRLRRAKWQVYTVPQSRLVHREGSGTGRKDRQLRKWLIRDFHRGALQFYCEHFELAPGSFLRALAATGLHLRAQLLMALDWIRQDYSEASGRGSTGTGE